MPAFDMFDRPPTKTQMQFKQNHAQGREFKINTGDLLKDSF